MIDTRKSSSKPKKGNFLKKKEGEIQALYQQNQPNQSQRYTSYQNHLNYQLYYLASSNQTSTMVPHYTSPNNQTQAVKTRLLSQTMNQAFHGLIIFQITNSIIPNPQDQ